MGKRGRKPGTPKTGGRKPGSVTILTTDLKERIRNILIDELSETKWRELFDSLDGKEKVSLIVKMLELSVPKTVQVVEPMGDGDSDFYSETKAKLLEIPMRKIS